MHIYSPLVVMRQNNDTQSCKSSKLLRDSEQFRALKKVHFFLNAYALKKI